MQSESYFEESVAMKGEALRYGKSRYFMFNILSISSGVFAILSLLGLFMSGFYAWPLIIVAIVFGVSFVFFKFKKDMKVFDCDYILVDDSLRIAAVANGIKRRGLAVINCRDILEIGNTDSTEFKSYMEKSDLKKIIAAPNFRYNNEECVYMIYEKDNEKKLLLFEASGDLLLAISKKSHKKIFKA